MSKKLKSSLRINKEIFLRVLEKSLRTISDLATETGYSYSYLSQVVNQKELLSTKMAKKISVAFEKWGIDCKNFFFQEKQWKEIKPKN